MKILTLDCETYDPLLLKYGSGWCFKYHYPEVEFEVLYVGCLSEGSFYRGFNNFSDNALLDIVLEHDVIVCHNALYDLGCLTYLFRDRLDLKDKLIVDTEILAKHVDQYLNSYSLNFLTTYFNCEEKKDSNLLHEYAWASGKYQEYVKEVSKKHYTCRTRPSEDVLERYCKSHMHELPIEIVAKYCQQDIKATKALYDVLINKLDYLDLEFDSDLLKCCLDSKLRGVCIDLRTARKLQEEFEDLADTKEHFIWVELDEPEDFNIRSTKVLPQLIKEKLNVDLPVTEKGNESINAAWLKEQPHPVLQALYTYRQAKKVSKDFLGKLIKYQEIIPEQYRDDNIGICYPTLRPYGATKTGRFTSGGGTGCLELSIQQIPRKSEEFGKPIRTLFLPHKGEQLLCCDFSSQEPRLQAHYASVLGCAGSDKIVSAYQANPALSYHQYVADLMHIPKDEAKTINLGLSYGMGIIKLSNSLGLSIGQGKMQLNRYYGCLPFMKQLQVLTSKLFYKNKYIKTLRGRKLISAFEQEYKALNKLIQGSAADQCIKSMVDAWKAGIKIMFSVHDELVATGDVEDLKKLKYCMENSYRLRVPMVVDAGIGRNWGEAK